MRSRGSTAIATLMATLVALPFAAPFSTCTLADIIGGAHVEASIAAGTVAMIGDAAIAEDDAPDPRPPHVVRLRTLLTVMAAARAPFVSPASADVGAAHDPRSDGPIQARAVPLTVLRI